MLNLHKDHRNLVNIALVVFVLMSMGVAVTPASEMERTAPLPGMEPLTAAQRRGLQVYVAENCMACHTQQVRNIEMDETWGARPSMASDYYYSKQRLDVWRQSPSLLGSERTGPDLTNVGQRQPGDQWHLLHLYDPQLTWTRNRGIGADGAILVRPDRFVAWRAGSAAEDPKRVLAEALSSLLGREVSAPEEAAA